jgi:lysophospholipase L1-like esterase
MQALITAAQQPWLNVRSSLPAQLYAATGREMNIYFANFLRSDVPLSTYTFVVTCSKGETDAARWFYTPVDGDAGNVTWSCAVYWGATLIATFSTTITFVAAASGTGVTRKLLAIGDSLTQGGHWLAEIKKLFTGDPMTLSIVGSLSTTVNDTASASQTVAHDAVSGKDINYFYSNAASPFVFSGAFNFPLFLTTNSITLAATDTVTIMLGTNDVFAQTTDAACALQIRTMLTQLAAIITSIKAAPTPPRIVLCMTIPPAASQDAFGVSYGTASFRDRFARNVALWREALMQAYDAGAVAGVKLCATHLNLDAVNGYPTTATALAARIPATYAKQSNGVHPTPSGASGGMWQMADTIYSYMKATA